MTDALVVFSIIVVGFGFAAARQAARRKGRTLVWSVAAFFFPPTLLRLELLPSTNHPPTAVASNLVLEWVGSLTVVAAVVVTVVQLQSTADFWLR